MAKNKVLQTDISLTLGLFVFLYLSRIFDKINRIIPSYDIHGSPYFEILKWFYPLASLFIGVVALSLFWLMQNKLQQRKWVEILYLSVGLFITFAYNLSNLNILQPFLSQYMFGSSVPLAIWLQNTFWINTYLHIAGSLIGVMGFLLLLFPKIKARQ